MTFPSVIPAQGSVGLAANGVSDTEIESRDPSELEGEPPGEPPGTVNRASYWLGGSLALQRESRPSLFTPARGNRSVSAVHVSRMDPRLRADDGVRGHERSAGDKSGARRSTRGYRRARDARASSPALRDRPGTNVAPALSPC